MDLVQKPRQRWEMRAIAAILNVVIVKRVILAQRSSRLHCGFIAPVDKVSGPALSSHDVECETFDEFCGLDLVEVCKCCCLLCCCFLAVKLLNISSVYFSLQTQIAQFCLWSTTSTNKIDQTIFIDHNSSSPFLQYICNIQLSNTSFEKKSSTAVLF